MKKEKQRIAIAEACGWSLNGSSGNAEWPYVKPVNGVAKELPDYLNDLNAMHEAEKVLSQPKHSDYICHLYYKTMGLGGNIGDWQKLATATAAQRAEAFLKTLNLWT